MTPMTRMDGRGNCGKREKAENEVPQACGLSGTKRPVHDGPGASAFVYANANGRATGLCLSRSGSSSDWMRPSPAS